ncbi:MAG TPA: hypothetical protein VFP55_07065, partial [Solirubrobacteraceae bacterium]|nr:hypothetical protein [Solirubrobacteraceae bacterium]
PAPVDAPSDGSGWSRQLGDAAADRMHGCLDAVVELELGENARDEVVNGVAAERELPRKLVVALAAGEACEDLKFADGQGGADRAGGVVGCGGDRQSAELLDLSADLSPARGIAGERGPD